MSDSPRWCQECRGYGDHHTDRHTFVTGVEEDRQRLFEIMERAIPAQGRETASDSMDLDYANDMLDDLFEDLARRTIAAELTRQVGSITAELICCDAYGDAEPLRQAMAQRMPVMERFKMAERLYPQSHDLCYWAGAIVHSLQERIDSLEVADAD